MLDPIVNVLESVLRFFFSISGSWGLAIILLTVAVRIVLLPLTIKQTRAMKAMQEIQPQIKALQEKHKSDKERLNKEIMAFYQENKVNPFGSCLPLLLQMPIFFALFQMLRSMNELKSAHFLWLQSLGSFDAIYILPVLMVVTTFWSQKQITSDDAQQKQMLYMMPVFLGFISLKLASGILLYWVTTNVWTIAQQYIMFAMGSSPLPAAVTAAGSTAGKDKKKSGKKPKKK